MKRSSNRIWWILGGVVVLLMGGLMAAKSAGWIGKPKTTEVEFAKLKSKSRPTCPAKSSA